MRVVLAIVVALFGVVGSAPARAGDNGPVIVIPGKPGVPVIMNGYDVSGAVVEGDWDLYRPGAVTPTVYRPVYIPPQVYDPGYYPAYGRRLGYGRYEIEPPANRRLPPPAQSFYRLWTSESAPLPASVDPPAPPPQIVVAPQSQGRRAFGRQSHYQP